MFQYIFKGWVWYVEKETAESFKRDVGASLMLHLNHFHLRQSVSTGPKMSEGVPGKAQLLKLIGLGSQYFNGIDITHFCWRDKNITPSIKPIPLSPSLPDSIISPFFFISPLYHSSLPTFLCLLPCPCLTMGGLRLLQVGSGGFFRVITAPKAHRNIRSVLWYDFPWSLSFISWTLLLHTIIKYKPSCKHDTESTD